MKTTVVYYSMGGNTRLAAERIAKDLGAELLEIRPKKAYPDSGFRKFFWGGKSAVMGETPALETYNFDAECERVILGFPVWASSFAPPIRTFVRENDLSGKRVAAFACESGSGAEKAFSKLLALLGRDRFDAQLILIDPKDKPSDENEQKLRAFCEALAE